MNRKRLCSVLLILTLLFGSFTTVSFGASGTKKMITYDVIKSKSNVYCATPLGVYKVNLKNKKVKWLFKVDAYESTINGGAYAMRMNKGYLYFLRDASMAARVYRIKVPNGKVKQLFPNYGVWNYAISKGKIYFDGINYNDNCKEIKRVSNLAGKKIKKSKYKVVMKNRKTNKKGYYIQSIYNGYLEDSYGEWYNYYTDYLVIPGGKRIKLCTYPRD